MPPVPRGDWEPETVNPITFRAMNIFRSKCLLLASLMILGSPVVKAGEEQDLIAVLRSDADAVGKAQACQRLRIVGTAVCAPALRELLADERLGHAARHALEGLPFPEATVALREALGGTSGLAKLGVIDSLGWRGDAQAVPQLTPLLADPDPAVASAVASALGRIGGEPAIKALLGARNTVNVAARPAVIDGLLAVADRLEATGDTAKAELTYPIYQALLAPSEDESIRIAAFMGSTRGMMGKNWDDALAPIRAALRSQVSAAQVAGLTLAARVPDPEATSLYAGMLAEAPVAMQIGLLAVLQQRGDPGALPKVRALAGSGDADVRRAVWNTLGTVGDATVVPVLAKAAASLDPMEQMAAQQSLLLLHRGDVTSALLSGLKQATPAERRELFRAMSGRAEAGAVPELLKLARGDDESLQPGALQALGNLADGRHLRSVVEWFVAAKEPSQREDVRGVLESMAERLSSSTPAEVASVAGGTPTKVQDSETEAVRAALSRLAAGAAERWVRDEAMELLRTLPAGKE